MIVSEGILAQKQKEEADRWANYLSSEYILDDGMLLHIFKVFKTMDESEMNASIQLLKDLLNYHFTFAKEM